MKKSQTDRLLDLLNDGQWHSTPDILAAVYGSEHLGIARIGARVKDLKDRGFEIESRRDDMHKTVWHYRLVSGPKAPPRLVPQQVMIDGVMHVRMVPAG